MLDVFEGPADHDLEGPNVLSSEADFLLFTAVEMAAAYSLL